MQDIRRSLMIFHLKEGYSKEELQKAYKKLVKKYHPDFNRENEDWAHRKMTEVNLAYEQCSALLREKKEPRSSSAERQTTPPQETPSPFQAPPRSAPPPRGELLSPDLVRGLRSLTVRFQKITGRYYENGLENRRLRAEGNRRLRYRICLREFPELMRLLEELPRLCRNEYDRHIQRLYRDFIECFYRYLLLDERQVPRDPRFNAHWYKMEEYLNICLIDYLAPFLVRSFGRVSWQVSFTHCLNHIRYLQEKFPRLEGDGSFRIIRNMIESYGALREEEEGGVPRFFPS